MFKRLSIIAAVFFLLTVDFLNPVLAGTLFDLATAITDAEQNFDYSDTNKNGDAIQNVIDARLYKLTDGNGNSYGFLTYGQPHGDQKDGQYRFVGYTYYGEDYTNMTFPPDQNANGADFATSGRISQPWVEPNKSAIASNDPNFTKFPGDGDPAYHKAILAGALCYSSLSNNGFKIDITSNPDFWNNIEQYVHILSPQTTPGVLAECGTAKTAGFGI